MTTETYTSYADQLPATLPQPVLVPIFDSAGREISHAKGVALRPVGGYSDPLPPAPLAVVGVRYTPPDLARLGQTLDDATALLGGYGRLGPARGRIARGSLSIVVGQTTGTDMLQARPLQGDPSGRAIALRLRSALDGTAAESIDALMVRLLCTNGLVGWGSIGGFRRRHTSGLDDDRALYGRETASRLPSYLQWQGRVLSHMREAIVMPFSDAVRLIGAALSSAPLTGPAVSGAGDPRAVEPVLTDRQRITRDRIVDLVCSADGAFVPAPIHGAGVVDGLQVLEAATAYDRHFARGSQERRRERVADGRGLGTRLLSWGIAQASAAGVTL